MERQLARRASKVRRQRQGWAIAVVSVVALLGIAGTAWALGAFDKSKPKPPAAAGCVWNDTGGSSDKLKDVGKPPASGQPRKGTETMTITTNLGVITASLDLAKASCTAASFAYLASRNFFAGSKCHRLVTTGTYLLQCGDPTGSGDGGPKYTFANEYVPNTPAPTPSSASPSPAASASEEPAPASKVIYPAGSIATANHGADTNGSQFYIIYKDSPLPPDYTLFGRVVSGLDLVQQVAAAGEDGAFASGDGGGHPKKEITIQALTVAATAPSSSSASPSPSASPSAKS
jgi:peptidyl-prolyl cis-trans isomerase B (cyclophilin B)